MKLFRYILFIGMFFLGNSIKAQTKITIALQSGSKDTICNNGTNVSFNATVNGCNNPKYQWCVNGNPISFQTSQGFSYNNFNNGDIVTCRQTDTASPCKPDTSNGIKITIRPNQALNLVSAAGTSNQNVCQYNAITQIKYQVIGATNASITGLPSGVTGVYNNGFFIISGLPTVDGTFNYQLQTNGSNLCGSTAQVSGTITVKKDGSPALIAGATSTQQVVFNGQNYFIRCGNSSNANIQIANATIGTGNIIQYKISWGDASNDTVFTVFPSVLVHNYNNGFYTLTLTTTSQANCISSISYGIFVGNSPQGTLGNPGNLSGCSPVTITFPITNTNVNVPGTTYKIDFGDGTIQNYTHPNIPSSVTHTYVDNSCGKTTSSGQQNSYAASMEVVNPCDAAISTISPIKISTSGIPKISIQNNIYCVGDNVQITDISTKGGFINGSTCQSGNTTYWTITPSTKGVDWTTINNLGDNGGTPNDADNWITGDNMLNIIFNTPGNYTISLHSANGCNLTSPKIADTIICIASKPTASFTIPKDTLCAGENLNFTSTSNTPLCGSNIYSWVVVPTSTVGCSVAVAPTFVSNTKDTSANPVINFSTPGSYVVSLTTTIQGTGCASVAFKDTITVKDKPNITLNVNPINLCEGATLSPTVTATCYTTGAAYDWTFTNATPATSNTQNPGTISFNGNGTSDITLKVTNVCGFTTKSQTVTIDPKPTVDSIPNFNLCAGDNFATLTFTGSVIGATYTWAASSNGIGLPALSGTTSINSFTATNTTSATTVTITVTPKKGNCTGVSRTFTITVNPKPTVNAISNIAACAGAAIATISFNGTISGAVFNWTNNNTATGLAASGSGNIASFVATNSGTLPITSTVTVTPSLNGCTGATTSFTIRVNPTPKITDSSFTSPSGCSANDGSITLKGLNTGSNYNVHYTVNGTPVTLNNKLADANGYITISNLGAGTYTNIYVETSFVGLLCPSNMIGTIVLTNPTGPATPTIAGVDSICSGNNLILTATNTIGGATYTWTKPDATTTSGTSLTISNITTAQAGNYTLVVTVNGCSSGPATKKITVNQTPAAPTTSAITYCQNATATALTASGTNLIWYNNIGLTNGSNITPTPTTTTVGTTTYYVIDSSNAGCKSVSASLVVTVNATPTISNLTKVDPQQCQAANGSISFNVIPTTGSYTITYTKGGVNQPAINSATPVSGIITINNLSAGTYDNIKVILNNCPSNVLGPITLSDPNPPATPVIIGVDSICSQKNLTLNPATLITNGVYTWTHPNGNTTIGNTYTLNNISTQDFGVYKLSVTLNLCKSNDATFTLRVDSTPVAPILISNAPVCTDSTIKLFATTIYPMTVTYNWTGVNSFTSTQQNPTISTATLAMAGNYNATITSIVGKCPSQTSTTNITVNETPHIVFKDSTYPTQCATATGNIRLSGLKANTTYQITYTVGGNTFNQTQTSDGSGILKIDTLRAGTYSNIFVTLNACPSNSIGSYTLVDPNPPATPVIIGVDSICSQKNLTLTASTTSAGIATYDWTGPNGFVQNGTNGTIVINNIITNTAATFTATATIAKCISAAASKTVRVDSTPIAPALTSNTPICTDSTIKLFATTIYPMTVTYNWTGVNSFTSTQQNPTISTATLAMAGNYNATVTSIVGKCPSQTSTTNITVNETPHIVFKDSTYPTQCATATGNIRLSGLKAKTAYQITYTVGGNTFNQTQTSDGSGILKIDTLRAGTYSNIFVTLNACPSNSIGSYILVDPNPPATPVIIGVDSICSQKNLTLNPATIITNGIYTWTHPNGNTTTSNTYTLNNISTQDFGVYKLSVTLNLCKSNDATFTLRVDSTPIAPALTSNAPVCTDSTIKLFATTIYPMAVNYSWTGVNGFTSTQQNPVISNATLAMAGNYNATVASVVGNCPSQTSITNVVVNETPNVAQLNDTTYKDGANSGNIIFTGTVANTTFNWVNSNPIIGLIANGSGTINFNATNTTPFPIFGIVTVTPSTQFCVGKPMNFKITVNPTPTLSSKLKDTICTDNLYIYQATSITPNVKYTWTRNAVSGISNAASSSTDSSGLISETLINTTTQPIDVVYTFKLYSLGSVNSVPFVLTVNPNAKAVYTFANDKLCTPAFIDSANIKVQDFSNATYEWYANNLLIGTGINFPGFPITNNGDTVYVKLKANSIFGCKPDSFEHKFYTVKTPTVVFTKSIAKGCGPLTVSFTNNSTPLNAPTYHWDFGNGQTSNLPTPNDVTFIADTSYNRHDTTYYITLTAYTQCDTIKYTDSVTVLPKPRALFQPDTTVGCSVFHFRAFNNSLGTHNTYTWDFGDSTSLVIDTLQGYYYHDFRVTNTDTFNVKLKAANVCGVDSFTVNVVVFPNTIVPKLVVDGTSNFGCAPVNIRFINNTRGANKFTVNFGDGSLPYVSTNNPDTIYHYYVNGGNYTATLKAQNSCTDSTVALTITLYNKPVASFSTSSNEYCKNDNIHFTNTSDTTLRFYWSFGDGVTSTAVHPNHKYSSVGNYTVSLIVKSTNASGAVCTDTAIKNIVVHEIPSPAFTTNATLKNCQPYYFEGIAPIVNGYIYNWKFYDASSIDTVKSGAVGLHTFYNVGTFNVRLIVFNAFGCSDTSFTNVKVIETPKALFTLSDSLACVPGKIINCANKTTYSAADPLNFEWYVDGIKKATTTNFSYNFTANQNITTAVVYNVKLIVINSFGCKDSITKKVIIQPKANAAFQINATQGCAPFSLQVNNSSLYANIFKWYVDGNLVSVAASPSPLQLSVPAKTYIIKLVADHTLGCGADSTVLQFTTYPKPIADFQIPVTSSCTGVLNINCFDLSSVAGGAIKKWNWSFGDGKNDTVQNPSHTYNVAGAFSVSLWVKDDKNCVSDVAFKTVKNFGKPKANFTVGNVCLGSDVVPINLSTTGFGSTSITSYLWNFGDGTFLTGNQPIHKYNTEGVYTITLAVTADSSCIADTITKPITIYGKPTASFGFSNNCVRQTTQFTNTSLFGFGQSSIGNSTWFFGDGSTSNVKDAQHIYTAASSYNVKLQVSGNRCPNLVDTTTKTITINQPRSNMVYPRVEGTRGTPIQLNAANDGVSYQWLPNIALNNAFIQNPIANFAISSPNIVNYQIKITDSFGCVATDKQEVWLFAGADIFLPTAFTPNGDNANDLFKPLYINIQKIQYFRVFDRWGKIVFETSDMSKSWDGSLAGKELPTDTYVWTIAGFTNDGTEIIRKGNVTLIRN